MKFLLDGNLSDRIPGRIDDLFAGSGHVKFCSLGRATDEAVWRFARDNGFAILTKDWDFQQMSLLRGFPPKVVFLKVGNCSTERIVQILRANASALDTFEFDSVASLLILEGNPLSGP